MTQMSTDPETGPFSLSTNMLTVSTKHRMLPVRPCVTLLAQQDAPFSQQSLFPFYVPQHFLLSPASFHTRRLPRAFNSSRVSAWNFQSTPLQFLDAILPGHGAFVNKDQCRHVSVTTFILSFLADQCCLMQKNPAVISTSTSAGEVSSAS